MLEVSVPRNTTTCQRLAAAIFDWAGTTVDFGSRAPVAAVLNAFEQAGVPISESEARKPMGRAKRDHLQALLQDPNIAARWKQEHGGAATESDLDRIYTSFLAVQAETVADCSSLIPGCLEAIAACRELGLKIGSSTGYTRELLAKVAERAAAEGYTPDVMLSADDVSPGRPAPWLCFENARRLNVYPMSAVVKVDDTPAGIAAGRNAGAWCVGVVESGNEVGLSEAALSALPQSERDSLIEAAQLRLTEAGAHYLVGTIAEMPEVVTRINQRLSNGETP